MVSLIVGSCLFFSRRNWQTAGKIQIQPSHYLHCGHGAQPTHVTGPATYPLWSNSQLRSAVHIHFIGCWLKYWSVLVVQQILGHKRTHSCRASVDLGRTRGHLEGSSGNPIEHRSPRGLFEYSTPLFRP